MNDERYPPGSWGHDLVMLNRALRKLAATIIAALPGSRRR